jgi:hypothetical protein
MPKSQSFSYTVPGTPEEVAQRLKSQTRFRPIPAQGSILVPADRPLAGWVVRQNFAVAVNERDWFTLMQAVAKGRLSAVPGGTRIEGRAGMPAWVTWQLRLATILAVLAGLVGAGAAVMDAPGPAMAVYAPLFLSVILIAAVLGIGWNVKNADDQVPELMSRLEAATLGEVEPALDAETEKVEIDERAPDKARAAAARQHQA